MGFWNNMAYAIRNARAGLAALGLLAVLAVLLYGRWSAPELEHQDLIFVPVVGLEQDEEEAQWIRVLVDTPDDGVVRLLWMGGLGPAFRVGAEAQVVVSHRADGRREYRLVQRP